MEFRKVLALRGPNIWARFPVLEAWVDLGELKDSPSDEIPGFNERLMAWLPEMIEHRCSIGERGGFFERLRRGTYQAHILEHVTLALQDLAGTPVGFGKARETSEEGVYKVVVRYQDETLGRACLAAARELCLAAVYDKPFDVRGEVRRLRELALEVCLGPASLAMLAAAKARGIPVQRIGEYTMLQMGQGARQRRFWGVETDRTSATAAETARDKELTRILLKAVSVPVSEGRPARDAEDAWAAAQELGLPVVVKPLDGNRGRGVSLNLTTREQVIEAFGLARAVRPDVLVERYVLGDHYRLLVVAGTLIAAVRRDPAQLVGNARSTILELVEETNADPRRGEDSTAPLRKIHLDADALEVLASQGYTPDSVPPDGTRVLLRRDAHLSTDGTYVDVTDLVHPQVVDCAVRAARMIGLDVAGLDVVARDISRPLEEQGGGVVEVNSGPGLRMHLHPAEGQSRPVAEAILGTLFPPGEDGRIPIVSVTGVNGKTTVTRLIAAILLSTGKHVGMTCTDGIYIDGRRFESADCSGPRSARNVLLNPVVEAAVLETARGGILREGLGFDGCEVAVVTNIGEGDHLGLSDIQDLEKLAYVKQTVVEAVLPRGTAVLNAADPLVAAMAEHCAGSIFYFARDGGHPVLVAQRARGGKVAFVRDGSIVLAEGDQEEVLISLDRVPLTRQGRVGFQVENVLAAVAAVEALGVSRKVTCAVLETFDSDVRQTPGRFNVLEIDGATVILDYGHNPSAVSALIEAIEQFPHPVRTAVFSAEGDRTDESILSQAERLGHAFDHVLLYEEPSRRRGRPEGEIAALLRRGLARGSRVREIVEIQGERAAIESAFKLFRPGEIVLIQVDAVEADLDLFQKLRSQAPPSSP
ncbi:MAG: cyanophycin synthetase [Isosphaeraceae bacterium]